ncbi:MAG TPA: GAF domain-containing SpoIIE family protein phosphatase [Jatrophihabitans sp.]|nr:GAF domain-containing SpoIIE family protein phosphatase [Jatrophihabitans sp.]
MQGEAADRLRTLLTLTDTTLARLDVEDMLVELLDRVRLALAADTAAVLLRDAGSDELVARAAWGLEDEVRQGVRVPVGVGFAGAIAAHRQPVVLDRVDETTVSNPILWEKGIRVMLGVPLFSEDEVIGVLHVGRLQDDGFSGEDAQLLEIAAERVARAIQARQLAVETAAAGLLERGLLPTRLPVLPGLEFAARYVPAESRRIGGDWYDAFTVRSGELWVITGDVAGHGLNAAVVMGRVKSALRSYALVADTPDKVLELTDRKVQHFEIGTMVTVVCATSKPPYDEFTICSAGHLPPVVAAPGTQAELLDLRLGPPLGVVPGVERASTTVTLPAGGVLLLYTDGLVERREEPLERGLARLCEAVTSTSPENLCRTVMHELVGTETIPDDIALLAIRKSLEPGRA